MSGDDTAQQAGGDQTVDGQPVNQQGAGEDETRRRFQEALARKGQHRSAAGGSAGKGGVHPHSGPAKAQRTFRRKSG